MKTIKKANIWIMTNKHWSNSWVDCRIRFWAKCDNNALHESFSWALNQSRSVNKAK